MSNQNEIEVYRQHLGAQQKYAYFLLAAVGALPSRLVDYFAELEGKHGISLTAGQKAWYHAKEKTLGDDMKRECLRGLERCRTAPQFRRQRVRAAACAAPVDNVGAG